MSKKQDKEQKGKHAVLVIAVGKHPKMGPGPRNYKKKAMKKAFPLLKNDVKRNERLKNFQARQARREERQQEQKAYDEGTASDEVKQRIDQSKANTASGVNQNLRYKPSSEKKRMPKQAPKPFDTEHFDRWVSKNSLGDKNNPNNLSTENLMMLAHKLGMDPAAIKGKQFEGADIGALKAAMQELGKKRYEEREKVRSERGNRRPLQRYDSNMKDPRSPAKDSRSAAEVYGEEAMWDKINEPHQNREGHRNEDDEEDDEEDVMTRVMGRLNQARSSQHEEPDEPQEHIDRYGSSSDRAGVKDLRTEESDWTVPFAGGGERKPKPSQRSGRTLQVLGPRGRGGEATFQEEHSGFTPPIHPTKLSSPQEEEEEEDLPEYPQFATGNPMDLAFRLLKMCKGDKTCRCPKCCKTNNAGVRIEDN